MPERIVTLPRFTLVHVCVLGLLLSVRVLADSLSPEHPTPPRLHVAGEDCVKDPNELRRLVRYCIDSPIKPARTPEERAAGEWLASAKGCLQCHEVSREGEVWSHTGHAWHHPDSVLINILEDGAAQEYGGMPPYQAILKSSEYKTLIAYIKSFWTRCQQIHQLHATKRADFQNNRLVPAEQSDLGVSFDQTCDPSQEDQDR